MRVLASPSVISSLYWAMNDAGIGMIMMTRMKPTTAPRPGNSMRARAYPARLAMIRMPRTAAAV